MSKLLLQLKKKWFDKINSGEKTHEYREFKDHWIKRIKNKDIDRVKFTLGYGEKVPSMEFFIKKISIINGKETDLKIDKPVYDIEIGERLK